MHNQPSQCITHNILLIYYSYNTHMIYDKIRHIWQVQHVWQVSTTFANIYDKFLPHLQTQPAQPMYYSHYSRIYECVAGQVLVGHKSLSLKSFWLHVLKSVGETIKWTKPFFTIKITFHPPSTFPPDLFWVLFGVLFSLGTFCIIFRYFSKSSSHHHPCIAHRLWVRAPLPPFEYFFMFLFMFLLSKPLSHHHPWVRVPPAPCTTTWK